jgi:hypothetical protein
MIYYITTNTYHGTRQCNTMDEIWWLQDIVDQCREQGVPVFVKQMGTYISKALNMKERHGGNFEEFPEPLRIREFPKIHHMLLFELPKANQSKLKDTIIRALWWKQPFASLMLHGKIETRTYPTKVRGKVLICATLKAFTYDEVLKIAGCDMEELIHETLKDEEDIPNGVAIGIGDLIDCRKMLPEDRNKCFVGWHPSRWCWVFDNVQPIEPFQIKGKQGWGVLDDETKTKIKVITQ